VVTPQGYSPVHFSIKKDVPVRLIFRQLGEVGCGNELMIEWGRGKDATLILTSPSDKQVLEFTPGQAGEFRFNCPHLIYRGVMTVVD
jgi:plastocyanin domain-containing protein